MLEKISEPALLNDELEKLKTLRFYYDSALSVCDPVDFQVRQKELLYAIAELLLLPLQRYEFAERNKLRENET